MEKRPLGVYVHIPFCVKKCNYCDFLSAPGDEKRFREYVSALISSIEAAKAESEDYDLQTIYIGGGTPSVLPWEMLEKTTETILRVYGKKAEDIKEFTVEVNPGTVNLEKLQAYRKMGANRLSVGIQSAKDDELRLLGRIHSFREAVETVNNAKKAGFSNYSVDIISALPGQTLEDYSANLDKIIGLEPKHISSYSLILEEGTPFYERFVNPGKDKAMLPSEELDREMYVLTKEKLEEAGYFRYEISNYAKPGFESIHNSSYWIGTEYRGFGLGAASLLKNKRLSNEKNLINFLKNPFLTTVDEVLEKEERMVEFMILGLRMTKGVSEAEFEKRFQTSIYDIYGKELEKLEKGRLITKKEGRIALTDLGLDLSNMVFERFIK